MTVALFVKFYASDAAYMHLISIGKMLWCTTCFLNKNADGINTQNTTKWVKKPLNVFFLSCWKIVDIVKLNRLP